MEPKPGVSPPVSFHVFFMAGPNRKYTTTPETARGFRAEEKVSFFSNEKTAPKMIRNNHHVSGAVLELVFRGGWNLDFKNPGYLPKNNVVF